MEPKVFYYSRVDPVLFFGFSLFFDCVIIYQFVLKRVGFNWWTYDIATFITGFSLMALFFFITYLICKYWLLPAFKNIPALAINENGIHLTNYNSVIPWNEILAIKKRRARGGIVIIIKLKDIGAFIANTPPHSRFLLRLRAMINNHLYIFTANIKGDAIVIYNSIIDFWDEKRYVSSS